MDDAFRELGAKFVFMDGWLEIKSRGRFGPLPTTHKFERAYANEHWPPALLKARNQHDLFLPHFHLVLTIIDANGLVSVERISSVLKKHFPLPRAVEVASMQSRYAQSEEAARCRRYALKRLSEIDDAELIEDARWREFLQNQTIFSGWTEFANESWKQNKLVAASMLSRQKTIDAMPEFEFPPGIRERIKP
jgi:hypothetical protein